MKTLRSKKAAGVLAEWLLIVAVVYAGAFGLIIGVAVKSWWIVMPSICALICAAVAILVMQSSDAKGDE